MAVTLVAVAISTVDRYRLARDLLWQCDELPVLSRFTSVGTVATTEQEARAFVPSLYSLRTGLIRSLRVPPYIFSPHTTTHLWTSLTLNIFGYSPLAGRLMPLFWGFVAVAGVAWASWLCVRSIPAACAASVVMALSPVATAYSAQVRGYSEAMALVPLLLVALELWRRQSLSWVRAGAVALLSTQLSLTVYTSWVYWVFPVLVVAVVMVPRSIRGETQARASRAMLVCLLLLLCVWMGLFTAERWKTLTFASTYGVRLDRWEQVEAYVKLLIERLLPLPMVTVPLVVVGVVWFRRAGISWWGWAMPAGVTLPIVLGIANGSPGYLRNLTYFLGPVSILTAVGLCAIADGLQRRWGRLIATSVPPAVVAAVSASAAATQADAAYRFLLPDWGRVVRAVDAEPKRIGARLFCPCAANHWQINWYRDRRDDPQFESLSIGEHLEVVLGAQLDDDGRAVIFRHNKAMDGIRAEVLPPYLSRVDSTGTLAGVELRRWEGVITDRHELSIGETPILVLAKLSCSPSASEWARFLREYGAYDAGVVPFKERAIEGGELHMMVAPARFAEQVSRFFEVELGAAASQIAWIALGPSGGGESEKSSDGGRT